MKLHFIIIIIILYTYYIIIIKIGKKRYIKYFWSLPINFLTVSRRVTGYIVLKKRPSERFVRFNKKAPSFLLLNGRKIKFSILEDLFTIVLQ